ncbi:MAG: hypothetical protein LC725_04810, partial [Lentisphaerae bacterium]|nr:hypothetical protein [Lentisphaerota bacterium]
MQTPERSRQDRCAFPPKADPFSAEIRCRKDGSRFILDAQRPIFQSKLDISTRILNDTNHQTWNYIISYQLKRLLMKPTTLLTLGILFALHP